MSMQAIRDRLGTVRGQDLSDEALAQETVALAEDILRVAQMNQKDKEKVQAEKIAGMIEDPNGKALTIALCDQAFRSHKPARIADQIQYLVKSYGMPRYMKQWEQVALGLAGVIGQVIPQVVVPPFVQRLRHETEAVILPGEEEPLQAYLKKRRDARISLILNQLGEAILGEGEAERRQQAYLDLLAREDVESISIKISSIFSQINLISFDHTVELIKEQLRLLYRTAMAHQYRHPDGRETDKFINLDMEEYRDLHLTVDAFCQVLDEPEFLAYYGGLVLQAYLPDSYEIQKSLTEWSLKRMERGGAPIKIRLVKGANLAMEKAEASLHGWAQAPYDSKPQVDANFKRMITYACHPDRAKAVHFGIASHNLFEIAYGLLLRSVHQIEPYITFEMLEGMANHQ
ncbi:MAG: proline dehydrogenase family protein, partial [Anaerolineae bacterium]|nr:proline dehydrogenase family protein [Anaerolineae bacterium]